MLVRKVLTHHVDVVLIAHLEERLHQIWQFEVAPCNFVVIIRVHYKKYAHDYGIGVSILEFWRRLQELQTRMRF